MKEIIAAIRGAVLQKNYYAALFTALSIPDICAALEHGKTDGNKYATWWTKYLISYTGFLSGNDCYALRCAMLHQGQTDTSDQRRKEILEDYVFVTMGGHCNLSQDNCFGGNKKSFLQLNVQAFCEDVCRAAENWILKTSNQPEVVDRIQKGVKIFEPGQTNMAIIGFL